MYTAYSRNVTSLIKHCGCYWPAEGAAVVHLGFHIPADRAQLLQASVQLHGAPDYTPVFLWYDCGPGGTQSPLCLQVMSSTFLSDRALSKYSTIILLAQRKSHLNAAFVKKETNM